MKFLKPSITSRETVFGYDWRLAFACMAGVLFLVFLPAFYRDFAIHNDYLIGQYKSRECCLDFPESLYLLFIGRPLQALLLNLYFMLFTNVHSFVFGRLINFLTLLASYYVFSLILMRRFGLSAILSLVAGVLVFMLPSSIISVIWIATFIPGIFNVFIVTVAYYLLSVSTDNTAQSASSPTCSLGYLLLFLSFFVYPPTAFFMLIFPFAATLFWNADEWRRLRPHLYRQVLILVVVSVFYFVSVKIILSPLIKYLLPEVLEVEMRMDPHYLFFVDFDIFGKEEIIREFLVAVFNVWSANYLPYFYGTFLIIVLLLTVGKFAYLLRTVNMEKLRAAAERTYIASGLFLLSCLPILLPAGSFVAFRIIFVSAAMAALLFLWLAMGLFSLFRNINVSRIGIAAIVAFALVFGFFRVYTFVDNAHREYMFLKQKIAQIDLKKTRQVSVIGPHWGERITNSRLFYDFRFLVTNFNFLNGFVQCVLEEYGIPREKVSAFYFPYWYLSQHPELKETFAPIIDMQDAGFKPGMIPLSRSMGSMAPDFQVLADYYGTEKNKVGYKRQVSRLQAKEPDEFYVVVFQRF